MTPNKNFTMIALMVFGILSIPSITTAQQISDKEIKTNVTAIDNALNRLIKLEPKSFQYDNSKHQYLAFNKGRQYGFIADDMANIFPELVQDKSVQYTFGKNAYRTAKMKSVDETSLIPLLVASIKEQQEQIDRLKQEVESLKNGKAVLTK